MPIRKLIMALAPYGGNSRKENQGFMRNFLES